jgi:peptide/nickel transport system substrate-binding protein
VKFGSIAYLGAALIAAAPAAAQKSKDTLRLAQSDNIAVLDQWIDPRPEVEFNAEAAYDTLLGFDEAKGAYVGILAKTITRVDPRTVDFELHENVTWSDGEKFDADDVAYTFNWVIDKQTKLRFKEAYAWIAKVEKLGPYKVRIVSDVAVPWDLARLSQQSYILPQHVHGPLAEKQDFGRTPVGTGPYRYIQVDKNQGLVAVKRETYPQASSAKPAPTIGRLQVSAVGDSGTLTALLLAGQIDIARNIAGDQATMLAQQPNLKVTLRDAQGSQYLMIDVIGRSGKKELTDPRVREAIMSAIDTDPYITIVYGDDAKARVKRPDALCSPNMVGCAQSQPFVKYDPARAKKLLADAGVPNGFDVSITAREGPGKQVAQIMAGQLRAVGIRASIELETFASYRDKQRDGKLQLLVSGYGGGGLPDVAQVLNFFFAEDPRNYHGRPESFDLGKRANFEMDPEKRKALVRELLDEVTKMHYIVPLIPSSNIFVHSADVKFVEGWPSNGYGVVMSEVSWR